MGNSSIVDRVDYSNDTPTASARGNLTTATGRNTAVGNANFGYIVGGYSPRTLVQRIDYSNDTATATPKGPVTEAADRSAAAGNLDFGYITGGERNQPSVSTWVDRIDYSNDTATALRKGHLSVERSDHAGFAPAANANPQ